MSDFVKCRCQHCGGHIEFDASGFDKGETRNVECPHCGQETILSVPKGTLAKRKIIVASIIAAFVILALFATITRWSPTNTQSTPDAEGPNAEWSKSLTVQDGDIQVSVVKVNIGVPPSYRFSLVWEGPLPLVITLNVRNLSSTQKIDFLTWKGSESSPVRDYATLTDNYDNQYARIQNPEEREPVSIYPGDSVMDDVEFEQPVRNIQWLHLELPAGNFDGSGTLRIEIPMKNISAAWDALLKAQADLQSYLSKQLYWTNAEYYKMKGQEADLSSEVSSLQEKEQDVRKAVMQAQNEAGPFIALMNAGFISDSPAQKQQFEQKARRLKVSVLLTPARRNTAGGGKVEACDKRHAMAGDATPRHKEKSCWRPIAAAD